VHARQGDLAVTAVRERTLLAMLLLHANDLVTVERLVEALWGEQSPRDARNQVQVCVSRLRKRLTGGGSRGGVIATDPAGYRVRVDAHCLDLLEFRRLTAEARAAARNGRPGEARDRYRAGLALWHGAALAGVDSGAVRRAAALLDEERVQVVEECVEVELTLGGAGELVGELTALVREHPYRERLHGLLMRALYRAGRHADALAAYRHLRQVLRDELGTEPGSELERLHRSILSRDPELDQPTAAQPSPAGPTPPVPRELPAEASHFVGRGTELARLRKVLLPAERVARRPAVMVLYGPGGVGKSALAVRAAHELAAEFPDGQLYVDLLGSTPGMGPLRAVEVLGRFLRSLGVHPAEIPAGEVEAAALFRTVTAERRLLLVLDNAADRDQVAMLVPSAHTSAVLVTSRRPLPTLDVEDRLRMDPLPESEAIKLLAGLTSRRTDVSEAASTIVAHCGGLPLAVRIVAGRLASRPDLPVQEYAVRLADRSRRLDELQLDDMAVRACIRAGYDALNSDGGQSGELAARVFRALGLLHVPDVAPGVLAAMLAEPDVETVRAALDLLVDLQLLEPVPPGRYRLHDLVRLVAAELAAADGGPADGNLAVRRAITFFTGALWRAEATLHPGRTLPFDSPPVPDDLPLPTMATSTQARTWVNNEIASLVSALEQTITMPGIDGLTVVWLSDAIWLHLDIRCDWQTAYRVSRIVLNRTETGDASELAAWALLLHGRSEACLGNNDAGAGALERALARLGDAGNEVGIALALIGLGIVAERRGRASDALLCYVQAYDAVHMRDRYIAASILANLCACYATLGHLKEAVSAGVDSMALALDTKTRTTARINLASVHCICENYAEAIRLLDEALVLSEEAGDRVRMCESLIIRSEANRRWGNLPDAATDADRARSAAEAWGYRFVAASAHSLRARIMAAGGRGADAAKARAQANSAYSQLGRAFRDPMIDLLLAQNEPSWSSRQRATTDAEASA
jgi:DNA-binding SARP family transcriptional activator/tetratricopeptide (TPR) repeat protein